MDSTLNKSMKPRTVPSAEGSNSQPGNDLHLEDSAFLSLGNRNSSQQENGSNDERLAKEHDNSTEKEKVLAAKQPFGQFGQPAIIRRLLSGNMSQESLARLNSPWAVSSFKGRGLSKNNLTVSQNQYPRLEMAPSSFSSTNSYPFMSIPGENIDGMGNYCQYGGVPTQENMYFPPIKKVVHLTHCVLYPPSPNSPAPTTRERPLGCKTVFVGGLPEKITEEIIKEIFKRCGTVETVRMSKKNFCHVRFSEEKFVDNALYFSGYRLRIENKDEASFSGRLHVDYAQAKDDQYDYECKQRALQRQARHQEIDYYRPPTPPVVHYSDKEASLICEKLKIEDSFTLAAGILVTWLEKGEITKKNAGSFFSMIQSTHNHVRKLQLNKGKYEEQLNEAKKMLKNQLEGIIRQFTEIEKIYKAASLQKCWDQFTKAQRKNIEMWKKQTEELKNAHLEEVINEREDEEMELSDDENGETKTDSDFENMKKQFEGELCKTQEENDSLKCQLEAAHNEMEELRAYKRRRLVRFPDIDRDDVSENNSHVETSIIHLEKECHLCSVISTFLIVHPFGASIEYICSYLHKVDNTITSRDVENVLKKYSKIFKEETTGIGASLEKNWYYIGLKL